MGVLSIRHAWLRLSVAIWQILAICCVSLISGGVVWSQDVADDASKSIRAIRVDTPPVIDGRLDDAVWQQAEVVTDFHQIRPGNGTPTSEPTELYVLYDDDAIYVAARLHDSNPELISAPTFRHGQGLRADDRLVLILDPFNTRQAGYRFETNANGVRNEALYQNVTTFSGDWEGIWESAGAVTEDGWVAELAIPFKTLAFDPGSDTWGFNFGRSIRRRGEEMAWVSRNRSYNVGILGEATGLSGMNQGKGIDIVPSLAVVDSKRFDTGFTDTNVEPSLDVFYRLTPSLNAALTLNTDFSAVEVDNRQVNLTRFGLFFPERRAFFLNDADLFQFGRIGSTGFGDANSATSRPDRENARPFFSRRIGLARGGAPVDLDYGGRVSGRVGRWNIGTLAIRQDASGAIDPSDLFVGRVSANITEAAAVGMIVTDGDPRSNLDNSVYGVDFRYINTRFAGGRQLEADAWFQQSDTAGLDGDDGAFGIAVKMPNNQGLRAGFGLSEVQENFNPALGFVNRDNIRSVQADVGYRIYPDSDFMQSVFFGLDAARIETLDETVQSAAGDLQSETLNFRLFEARTNSSDEFRLRYTANEEFVDAAFTIYEDQTRSVSVPAGQYSFDTAQIRIETGRQRAISAVFSYETGDFFDGTIDTADMELTWNRAGKLNLTFGYEWNDIELTGGRFISRLVSLSSAYALTPNIFWINLIQYDNVSEVVGINTRLQWIPQAGQEGFIVLNHNLQDFDKDNTFNSANSDISVKFRYTFRF